MLRIRPGPLQLENKHMKNRTAFCSAGSIPAGLLRAALDGKQFPLSLYTFELLSAAAAEA